MDSGEESCFDRVEEFAVGRYGGGLGSADGFCRGSDQGSMRELLDEPLSGFTDMGSPSASSVQAFDCVSLRFANGNFAQDDRLF